MKIARKRLTVQHLIAFPRPAAGLVVRAGQLLERMTDSIGSKFPIASSDVSTVQSSRLDDWALRVGLFNGLVSIKITADGLQGVYTNLGTQADIDVAIAVESSVVGVLAEHSPALQFASEKLMGHIEYDIEGGEEARKAYFSSVSFPGRSLRHQNVSYRAMYTSATSEATVMCEIAPMYANAQQLFVSFDVDVSKVTGKDFAGKATIGMELIAEALGSFGLEQTVG